MIKRKQINSIVEALLAYAERINGDLDLVSAEMNAIGTVTVDAYGALCGSRVALSRRVESLTGRRFSNLSSDEIHLWETLEACVCATAHAYEQLDDEGCNMGIDLDAYRDFIRESAKRSTLADVNQDTFQRFVDDRRARRAA